MEMTELSFRDLILLGASKSLGDKPSLFFDNSSLGTTDSLSHTDENLSLSSLRVIRSPAKPSSEVTLKEMVLRRHRTAQKCGGWIQRGSKKIRKDNDDDDSKEKTITSASFAKRQHTQKWNDEETKKFYKVLLRPFKYWCHGKFNRDLNSSEPTSQ